MKSGNNPLSRRDNIVIQEMNDEILVYDLSINKAFCLNKTSAMIWQECDGTKSVAEISRILSKKVKSNISEDIVWLAVRQFKTDNLLANSNDFVTLFDGLSRREIVKRIGFTSLVAFPVISSVVAPSAAHAASAACGCSGPLGTNARDKGCPCLLDSDCCGNCLSNGGNVCDSSLGLGAASCCATPPPCAAPGGACTSDAGCCPATNRATICFNGACILCGPGNGSLAPGAPCTVPTLSQCCSGICSTPQGQTSGTCG